MAFMRVRRQVYLLSWAITLVCMYIQYVICMYRVYEGRYFLRKPLDEHKIDHHAIQRLGRLVHSSDSEKRRALIGGGTVKLVTNPSLLPPNKRPKTKNVKKEKNKKRLTTSLLTHPTTKADVIQYRHPVVRTSLQNCFPQGSSPLLRAPKRFRGLPARVGWATIGFELGTCETLGWNFRWDEWGGVLSPSSFYDHYSRVKVGLFEYMKVEVLLTCFAN